jgi:hypothetical protein
MDAPAKVIVVWGKNLEPVKVMTVLIEPAEMIEGEADNTCGLGNSSAMSALAVSPTAEAETKYMAGGTWLGVRGAV